MPLVHVERSARIDAPRGQVYATVRDFRQWPLWSPWLICEPDCPLEFAKDGRSYAWDGKFIGAGKIEVLDESEGVFIEYRLTFLRPWKSVSSVKLLFANAGDESKVTWIMDSKLPFFLFWMKRTMAAMISMDFDRGLRMLKELVERGEVRSRLDVIGRGDFAGFTYWGIRNRCEFKDIGVYMENDFKQITDKMKQAGVEPAGPPFSLYHEWNLPLGEVDYTLGFPLAAAAAANPPEGVDQGEMDDCAVFSVKHTGPYHHLGNAWAALMTRKQAKVFACQKGATPFEIYHNDPEGTPDDQLVAVVHMPVK